MTELILASASPRRAELLDQIGVSYQIQSLDLNEDGLEDESPEDLVQRLAIEKSKAVVNYQDLPVLGADTLGIMNDTLLVKPEDYDHAHQMLSQMSANWHEILTAVAVTHDNKTQVKLNRNRVLFRKLSDAEIKAYWLSNEPQDKAGAYAVQGLAASFIERIEGSYSGIMGLPLFETSQLLENVGIKIIK